MLIPRIIPCLLLRRRGLVKTVKFDKPVYLGDPINIVKIFNDKEVDEVVLLDIDATPEQRGPNYNALAEIVSESFVPFAYGGGIRTLDDVKKLFALGIEKVVINSFAMENPDFIRAAAEQVGSQSVVVCLNVKGKLLRGWQVMSHGARRAVTGDVAEWANKFQQLGAGELLVNAIDRDGMMKGYDLELVRRVSSAVTIPVVACGGAGVLEDLGRVVKEAGAAAASAGSLFVFQGPHRAVLINFPERKALERLFNHHAPQPISGAA